MSASPQLKICGATNAEDARLIGSAGAGFCGILVDVGFSERSLTLEAAREVAQASGIPNVVLLCNPEAEVVEQVVETIKPFAVQLLCEEPPVFVAYLKSRVSCQIWKTLHLSMVSDQATAEAYVRAGADALLVDSVDASEGFLRRGGTGKVADWGTAAAIVRSVPVPVFLAGGINPDNVERAILTVRPAGIDLCSGVEAFKGKKDPKKVRALVANFRSALAKLNADELGGRPE